MRNFIIFKHVSIEKSNKNLNISWVNIHCKLFLYIVLTLDKYLMRNSKMSFAKYAINSIFHEPKREENFYNHTQRLYKHENWDSQVYDYKYCIILKK